MFVSKKWHRVLWLVTGLVALLLLVATLRLATRAQSERILGQTVYLISRGSAAMLHQEPDPGSPVVGALVHGSTVVVLDQASQGGETWYLVHKSNMAPGWIPAANVSRDPP
jgi:hypothetical protein